MYFKSPVLIFVIVDFKFIRRMNLRVGDNSRNFKEYICFYGNGILIGFLPDIQNIFLICSRASLSQRILFTIAQTLSILHHV